MVYTHVLKFGAGAVRSPLDALSLPPVSRPSQTRPSSLAVAA